MGNGDAETLCGWRKSLCLQERGICAVGADINKEATV